MKEKIPMNSIKIEGEKIILRDWIAEDLEMYSVWQTDDYEWQKFDGPYYERDRETILDNINQLSTQIELGEFKTPRIRLVIASKETNIILGTVSCYWESIETNWLCAGISIYDEKFWGKGIGKDALSLWVDYLFKNYDKIVRLDLRTWSGNKGMMKLAEKLGFVKEACFRNARIVDGEYYDGLGYGILKSEWIEINGSATNG